MVTGGGCTRGQEAFGCRVQVLSIVSVSNVDFRIDKGNLKPSPFVRILPSMDLSINCDIRIGSGKAGMYMLAMNWKTSGSMAVNMDNFLHDFSGWPMMMSILTLRGRERRLLFKRGGFAIVNMHVKNTPVALKWQRIWQTAFMWRIRCGRIFREAGVRVSVEGNTFSQLNLVNVDCRNVPYWWAMLKVEEKLPEKQKCTESRSLLTGLGYQDLNDASSFREICEIEPVAKLPVTLGKDLPVLPAMETWGQYPRLRAKGDGKTDDTEVFEKAVSLHKNIYVPQGWYRLTRTLKLSPGTKLIVLHPFWTQFLVEGKRACIQWFRRACAFG